MKVRQWITGIVLLLLIAAAIVGMVWTREKPASTETSAPTPSRKTSGRMQPATQRSLVDQRPLQTAQHMASMASTPEEQGLAREAERVGDHEVDLAFLDAIRTAEQNPPPLSPEARQIATLKAKAAQIVKDDL